MTIIISLLIIWIICNLMLTLALYACWFYERRSHPETAHLAGGLDTLAARHVLIGMLREVAAFTLLQATSPLAMWLDKRPQPLAADNSTPVLLVHGYGCNSSCMLWLKQRLKKAGHRRIRAISYRPPTGNIHKLVPQLKQQVRKLLADSGASHIHYVAHSMGGVLVRELLRDPEFADSIATVVCIGSPHTGSRSANLLAPFTRGAVRQMVYQSDFVTQLPITPGNARYFSIASQLDDLVLPVISAQVQGMTHLTLDYLGHCSLLYSRRVAGLVSDCLNDTLHSDSHNHSHNNSTRDL